MAERPITTLVPVGADVYDDEAFFDAYAQLRRSKEGLAGAPEWPALRALVPPLDGRRALDLGCGYGWFCRWARGAGAAHVVGVDGSERMLDRARSSTDDPAIEYVHADLDELVLDTTFDVVFSSLALHYVADLDRLLGAVRGALVDDGVLVCSLEHPIFTAPRRPGFVERPGGGHQWPIDGYQLEGERTVDWLGARVRKQHRTLETVLRAVRTAGLDLTELVEWAPDADQLTDRPHLAIELERPIFLFLSARAGAPV